ncbi:MAG: MdtA/MuxA family multidrug efflux RND transporter periplasmic adaptor subunit [Stellaceae bacterium]
MDEVRLDPDRRPSETKREPPEPRRGWGRPALWTALLLAVLGALAWWVHTRPAPSLRAGRFAQGTVMPVVPATAAAGTIDITYDALGTVTPLATVSVQAQIAGRLTEVAFHEGQEVKKGDFLAQIDPRPYQAALDQSMGQLRRDQAILQEARTDLARYQKLAAQNSIARQQAEDQQYVVQQDEGTVKVDEALVENAQLNLSYCRIVSPIAGRIGLRQVDPGNYVQVAGATPIAVITQMQPMSVVFTLPEDILPQVLTRLRAGATLPVTAYDRSNTTKLGDGTLTAVDSAIDPATGTVKLRADFPNPGELLFPNQFVNAHLLIDTLKDATVIPAAAVQRGQPGTFVYLIKPDDTVTVRKVTLGPQQGESVAVTQGLSPGDKIVLDGADKLKEGAKIALRQEQGTQGAAPQVPSQQSKNKAQRGPGGRQQ